MPCDIESSRPRVEQGLQTRSSFFLLVAEVHSPTTFIFFYAISQPYGMCFHGCNIQEWIAIDDNNAYNLPLVQK